MNLGEDYYRQAIETPHSRRNQAHRVLHYQAQRQGLISDAEAAQLHAAANAVAAALAVDDFAPEELSRALEGEVPSPAMSRPAAE